VGARRNWRQGLEEEDDCLSSRRSLFTFTEIQFSFLDTLLAAFMKFISFEIHVSRLDLTPDQIDHRVGNMARRNSLAAPECLNLEQWRMLPRR
jgi:hypothetical protein